MNVPALPCPPWCDRNHDGGTNHSVARYTEGHKASASLFQTDYGTDCPAIAAAGDMYNGRLALMVMVSGGDSVVTVENPEQPEGLRQAQHLAGFLGELGHPQLTAAIGELLELVLPIADRQFVNGK